MRIAFYVAVWAISCVMLRGGQQGSGLRFDLDSLELKAGINDKLLKGSVGLKNQSDAPIGIKRIYTSCTCTQATVPTTILKSGERIVVDIVVEAGDRVGSFASSVLLVTAENGETREYSFPVKSKIESPVALDRRLLRWKVGNNLEMQSVRLESRGTESISVAKIEVSNSKLVRAVPVEEMPGKKYRIDVTPLAATGRLQERIEVTVRVGDSAEKLFTFFVRRN